MTGKLIYNNNFVYDSLSTGRNHLETINNPRVIIYVLLQRFVQNLWPAE